MSCNDNTVCFDESSVMLPVELWIVILTFLKWNEEFNAAQVCRMFRDILTRQRQIRGDTVWHSTDITPYCSTLERINSFLRNPYCDIRTLVKPVRISLELIKQKNYETLVEFVNSRYPSHDVFCEKFFETLVDEKEYDIIRRIVQKGWRMPFGFINIAVKTGQYDIVLSALQSEGRFYAEHDLMKNAVKSADIRIVRFIYDLMRTHYINFNVSMSVCVETGQIDIVKFAHKTWNVYLVDSNTTFAFEKGFTDILEYLIVNGCPVKATIKDELALQNPDLAAKIQTFQVIHESDWYFDY